MNSMMNGAGDKAIPAALGALCLLCVVALIAEMSRRYELDAEVGIGGDAALAEQEEADAVPDTAAADNPAVRAETEYDIIVERPLFMPDRKPYVAPKPVVAPRPETARKPIVSEMRFSLSAVVMSRDKSLALIRSGQNGKLHKLYQGDKYQGWQLIGIRPDHISLRQGDEIRHLELPGGREPQASATRDPFGERAGRE